MVHNPAHTRMRCQQGQIGRHCQIGGTEVMNYQALVSGKDNNVNNLPPL